MDPLYWNKLSAILGRTVSLYWDRLFDYYDAVVSLDIQRVDNVDRDPEQVKQLMRSYTRYQGNQIFVVEDMHAWNPNLRSKTAIRSADTRYFVDPSIATATLGLGQLWVILDTEGQVVCLWCR